jgi:hypothetical protein
VTRVGWRAATWAILAGSVLAVLLASCGGSTAGSGAASGFVVASAPRSAAVPGLASEPALVASASAELAGYRVTIATDRTVFRAADAVPITTTLTYVGPAVTSAWWGSGSGPIRFLVEQLDGPLRTGGLMTADCGGPHPMPRGVASTIAFVKSGTLTDMPAGWFDDPQIHLPPGLWRITAETAFELATVCGGGDILMDASLVIRLDP